MQFCFRSLNSFPQLMSAGDFWEDGAVVNSRETVSKGFRVQRPEYSNVRKRREVGPWDPAKI